MAKSTAEKYSPVSIQTISQIRGQEDFVEFLRTELEWPIPLHIDRLEDVSIPHDLQRDFGFSQAEDRIQVSRLLNLNEDQPWGIFLFEFKTKRPYLSHLRQLLRKLSSRRTLQRGDPIWDRNDLLFICTQDWQEYQFVHFSGERPESAVISSFGWKGPDDRFLHTLCKHNLPRLRMPDPAPDGSISADDWRSQWRDAFNIKPVTDEFYATLKEVFHAVESGITGLQGEDRRAFTELMINRLIFLKFVEKKGWLNNDRDYLYHHFQKFGGERYWKDFLYHLFFEGLNTDPAQRPTEASRVLGEVPYLNAELFSLSGQWNDRQVEVEGRSLDLLFDKLLNPYNFTVAETSPLEVEVAFNQDLLGYAYEELIADQHGQGAYYTHPTEVNLMCRESLRAYLEERCPQVEKEQIARLVYGELSVTGGGTALAPAQAVDLYSALHDVTICDPAIGSGTFPVAMVKHLFTCLRSLGQILKEYAPFRELIDQAALTDWRKGYELKLHVIERSIYGCDIDYFAVQIAKLRFWIELMVECDQPVPLPNFDFKLLLGDALVSGVGTDNNGNLITLEEMWGHPTKPRGQVSLSSDLARKFAEKKKDYYSIQEPQKRMQLRKELLEDRENLIQQALQFSRPARQRTDKHILWQIDFAEVFQGINPGFDIVIANPPYLRKEEIDPLFKSLSLNVTKKVLQEEYLRTLNINVSGHSDLYIYFYLRGLSIISQNSGVLCFITSNAWLDVGYGGILEKYMLEKTWVRNIYENRFARSFAGADINTVIVLCVTKDKGELTNRIATFTTINEFFSSSSIQNLISDNCEGIYNNGRIRNLKINQQKLLESGKSKGEFIGEKWGGKYLRGPDIIHSLLSDYSFTQFGEIADVVTYLNTLGRDDFFFMKIYQEENDLLLAASQKYPDDRFWIEKQFLIPIVRSPSRLSTPLIHNNDLDHYLLRIPPNTQVERYRVKEYVRWGERQKFNGNSRNKEWWILPKQAYEGYDILISRHHHNHFNVYFNPNKFVANSFYGIKLTTSEYSYPFVMGYLSSSLGILLSEIYGRTNQGQGVLNTYGEDIQLFPIIIPQQKKPINWLETISKFIERPFLSVFDDIRIKKENTRFLVLPSEERNELDSCIFEYLGLSKEVQHDIQIQANFLIAERLGRATTTQGE